MPLRNIERFSIRYELLKPFFIFAFNRFWYRKTEVAGRENIPKKVPLLLVSNHQNALMDPLALVFNVKGQPVFLARSDIFKSRIYRIFLYFFKVMPIFRIRDGWDAVKQNDFINKKVIDIFLKKKNIGIMPEGNHDKFKRLRPLKKGFARMVFQAEEENNFNLGIEILPAGIDYGSFYNFRTTLFVNFGKPIKVSDFREDYAENPQRAMQLLVARLSEELKKLMIHIESVEYYDTILRLIDMFKLHIQEFTKKKKLTLADKFRADKIIVEEAERLAGENPLKMDGLRERISDYTEQLNQLKIRDWIVRKEIITKGEIFIRILTLLIFSPVFLYGFFNNLLAWFIPQLASRKLEDPQFISSIRFGVFFFLYPLLIVIQTLIVIIAFHQPWLWLAYPVSLPVSGLIAFHYYIFFRKTLGMMRWNKLRKKKKNQALQLIHLRKEIIEIMRPLTEEKIRNTLIQG
ncbi:MAG: hypothetical protein GX437_10350 [Sphingobacteriales bacterium]|nr:hypothetical protein [Sphingobacteriales bacterium]